MTAHTFNLKEIIEDPADRASVREMEKQEKSHAASLYRIRQNLTANT